MMRVIISKPDLDTCLTGLIMGVEPEDEVFAVRGNTRAADLKDPQVLCIEAGGSGAVGQNNFDHHDVDFYFPPACVQAYEYTGNRDKNLKRLVEYVSMVDENINDHPPISFPSLSNLFSGMLFIEKGAVKQFFAGLKILRIILKEGMDPFSRIPVIPQWEPYIMAKMANMKHLKDMLNHAEFYTSRSGLRIGYCEQDAIGGIGTLYQQGCQVVVLYSERFGNPPVRKCTIAGNKVRINYLRDAFNEKEKGWGGRKTILGSPKWGTFLNKQDILKIVLQGL